SRDGSKTSVAVAGVDIAAAEKLNSWWQLDHLQQSSKSHAEPALFGKRAYQGLDRGQPLTFAGHELRAGPIATITSGGPEEDRIYISQQAFQDWTGLAPNLLEISYTGSAEQIQSALDKLKAIFRGEPVEVRPVRKIVAAEGRVIRKTRAMMFACGLLIALTVALCVGSTLTASVLERRRDFALMKALGASQTLINGIFTTEAALLGVVASLLGFLLGGGLADLIGLLNFHASVTPSIFAFPGVLLVTLIVALGSALLPLAHLQQLEPAVILKGD
ncbi:MAG: ABC transporter permease, partial [Acidobacteriaceae bacterium]